MSRSSSSSTWSPLTALTGTTSAASTSPLAAISCSAICFFDAASVLVTTTTTGAFTSRSWRAMNASPVPTGWSAGMQKTITSTSESVSRTTSLRRLPSRLFGLCRPGVSTRTIWPPGRCTTPRMACRVVCGRLLTMPTFSPTSALVSVVFPAFGRPTRAAKPLRCGGWSGVVTCSPRCARRHVTGGAVSRVTSQARSRHQSPTGVRRHRPRSWSVVPRSGVLQHSGSRSTTRGAGARTGMIGRMARGQGLPMRAARERDLHLQQVRAYGFFAGRGPRSRATSVPAPLRYWQYDLPRPVPVVFTVVVVAIWLAVFGWGGGREALLDEAPLALGLGLLVLLCNVGRLTVSAHGMSLDIGATRTPPSGVVPLVLVREVRVGHPPEGWPPATRRGGWLPGRTRVSVRHLGGDGESEQALTRWVRDADDFATALGVPLGR